MSSLFLGYFSPAFATPTTPTSDFIDNGNGTVTHKKTGIMWMRCSMGQTWSNGACLGTANFYTYAQAIALKPTFAGYSDWRLPNIAELPTIVERENYSPPINRTIFPDTPSGWWVWSSSPVVNNSYYAWIVRFSYGTTDWNLKDNGSAVRLMRSGQWAFGSLPLTTPTGDFTDNQNGTITHKRTGLMWQRCEVGQTWSGVTCLGSPSAKTYAQALALTNTFAGYTDWHLPTIDELLTIVEYGTSYPAINSTLFPHASGTDTWSSTSQVNDNAAAWYSDFYQGGSYTYDKTNALGVRLVRGKWPADNNLTVSADTDTSDPNAIIATCNITPPTGLTITNYAWKGFSTSTEYSTNKTVSKTLSPTPQPNDGYVLKCAAKFSNGIWSSWTSKLIHQVTHKSIYITTPSIVEIPVNKIKIPLDADNDALPDAWENYGVQRYLDSSGNIVYFITSNPLPVLYLNFMGADALCRDIFVEVDQMTNKTLLGVDVDHNHFLKATAMEKVRLAFKRAPINNPIGCGYKGINLHVDNGTEAVMAVNPNNQTIKTLWGTYSKSSALAHNDVISPNATKQEDIAIIENDFYSIYKNQHFPLERRGIFHYTVSGHFIFSGETSSGVSLGNDGNSRSASDFVVTLGAFTDKTGTEMEQAGTLMHELGHNLGLYHGGFIGGTTVTGDDTNYKPSHFSVMNYRFQSKGLIYYRTDGTPTNGLLDYSRVDIANDLVELSLFEPVGVKISSSLGYSGYPSLFGQYGVPYTCKDANQKVLERGAKVNAAIDWNCDGDVVDSYIHVNINMFDPKSDAYTNDQETLKAPLKEWNRLVYTGSGIKSRAIGGGFDGTKSLQQTKLVVSYLKLEEVDVNTLQSMYAPNNVEVSGKPTLNIIAGGIYELTYQIKNTGLRADTYSLEVNSQSHWNVIKPLQKQVNLQPNQSISVRVNVTAPFSFAKKEVKDIVTLRAVSTTNPDISDSIETRMYLK